MNDISTTTHHKLIQTIRNHMREDAAGGAEEIANREYERLLDLEAVRILAQATLIINGNATACAKIAELCGLLLTYDEDEEDDATEVDQNPRTADENVSHLVGARRKMRKLS